jgi:hypothetical protein
MARAYRTRTVLAAALAAAACGPADRSAVAFVDLIEGLPAAERRAALPADTAIRVGIVGPPGDVRPSITTAAPARIIWSTKLPSRARLETAVSLVDDGHGAVSSNGTARIGISDDRRYVELARIPLDGTAQPRSWRTVSIDLRAYSGWQWSLFYRPWERTWRIIFNADGPGVRIAWARPMIRGQT